jgi:hypothetical protein
LVLDQEKENRMKTDGIGGVKPKQDMVARSGLLTTPPGLI